MRHLTLLSVFVLALGFAGCDSNLTDTSHRGSELDAPLLSSVPVATCPDDQTLVEANGFKSDDKNADGWICVSINGAGKVLYGDNNANASPGELPIDRLPPEAANGVLHSCLSPDARALLPVEPGEACSGVCQGVQTSACTQEECLQLCEVAGGSLGVTIDASALTAANFTIRYVGTYPTSEAVTLDLSSGGYRITAAEGSIDFSVTPAGEVAYEPTLEGILEGAGTALLTVNGATVQMTGPQLTTASGHYLIVNTGVFPTAAVSTLHVLPGTKRIQAAEGGVHVSVTQEGTFTYDPVLEGILEGAGTSLLTMNGAAVQMTGPQLTTTRGEYLIVNTGVFPTAAVSTLHVLPGTKRIQAAEGGAHVTVTQEGTFTYDAVLEGILGGAGTSLLTMNGATVQMTGPQLTTTRGEYLIVNTGVFPTAAVSTLHVLPGTKRIQAAEGGVHVTVTQEGTFTYDPMLEGILAGAGTPLLTMNGATVQITGPQLTTTRGEYLVVNTGVFPTAAVSTLHVLPGTKRIQAAEGGVHVSVTQESTFTYDPLLEGILEGAATSLLTMNGAAVVVDATSLSAPDFMIINVGIFPASSQVSTNLLPGNKRFRSADIDFDFQVLAIGLIDYDPSLDGVLDGRNTTILTIMP